MREEFRRREKGYRLIERLRRAEIRRTNTAEAIVALDGACKHALRTLPPRDSSGLAEFYRILLRKLPRP
jgi:hypothetical protein